MQGGGYQADPSEHRVPASTPRHGEDATDAAAERSVWDEPAHAGGFAAVPLDAITYATWLEAKRRQTSPAFTWWTTLWVALAAGPWAVLGTLLNASSNLPVVMIVLVGPLTEEVMKIAAAAWVVETRPHWFGNRWQIALCALAGGLAFAAIENVLYLRVYIPDPSPGLVLWRWTVCVALHVGCSFLAGLGLIRVWSSAWRDAKRPDISLAFRYLVAAVIVHGLYNALAQFVEFDT